MSFNRMKSFCATAAIATVASILPGGPLSAYQEKWNDTKVGSGGEGPNSLFRIDGAIWGAYEMADKKPGNQIDSRNGFRVGRTYVNIRGDVKEGAMKGWGYRITIDSATGDQAANGSADIFLKYAYIQAPLAKGTYLRIGQQHVPTVDGQAGTSLQKHWGHRYLDDDGKAMWEELGVNSSTDLGVGFIHKNKYFNAHLLLANGESYKSTGNGDGVSSKGNTTLSTVANGSSDSYGLDLYGMVALTPFANDMKDKGFLTIAFPFRFQNIVGVQGREYENVTAFDPATGAVSVISGQKNAFQDYAYGTEVDLNFKTNFMKLTVGAGTVIKVDRRADAILFDENVGSLDLTNNADLATFYSTNYARGGDSRGRANYTFAHARFGNFGLVARYSTGTGSNSLNEKLGVSNGVSTAERLIIEDIKNGNGIDGDLTVTEVRNFDQGRARFTKTLFGVTYAPNPRFAMTFGVSNVTGQTGSGETFKTNTLAGIDSYTENALASAVAPGSFVTDNDLIGEKNYDRQTFIRMVYSY